MDASPVRMASHFGTERVPYIWYFVCILRVNLSRAWLGETYKRQKDAQRSSSHLSGAPKEGFETLHKQWMPLIVEEHPNFYTERVLKITHFVCILRVNLGGKCLGETNEWQKDA